MATLSGSGIENFRNVLSGDASEILPKADRSAVMASHFLPLKISEARNVQKNRTSHKITIFKNNISWLICSQADRATMRIPVLIAVFMGILCHIVSSVTWFFDGDRLIRTKRDIFIGHTVVLNGKLSGRDVYLRWTSPESCPI